MIIHPTYRYPNGLQAGPPPEGRTGWRWWKRCGSWLCRGALVFLGLLVLVLVAWLASNWHDAPVRPRPPELALPATLAPVSGNVYFALLGLHLAPDRDAAQVGQALWQDHMQLAQTLATTDPATQQAVLLAQVESVQQRLGPPLPAQPTELPWACDELTTDCVALSLAQADQLARQRQTVQAQGARCDATVDLLQPGQNGAFEEALPTHWNAAALPTSHMTAAALCSRWQHHAAVLAFRQGRKEEAWRLLARSNRWHRALHAGMHTLISHHINNSILRRHLAVVGQLAVQDPAWLPQALPLLAPFEAPEAGVRRWVVAESALQQASLQSLQSSPVPRLEQDGAARDARSGAEAVLAALMQPLEVLQRHHIGWHPVRTAQAHDERWVQLLLQLDTAGLPAVVEAARNGGADAEASVWRWWRNPGGRLMLEVSRDAYASYLQRPLDLELHREAALLGLQALRQGIAPAARAAWSQQQAVSPTLRERLAWSADGRSLNVRSWAADGLAQGQELQPRDRIVITLEPRAPA